MSRFLIDNPNLQLTSSINSTIDNSQIKLISISSIWLRMNSRWTIWFFQTLTEILKMLKTLIIGIADILILYWKIMKWVWIKMNILINLFTHQRTSQAFTKHRGLVYSISSKRKVLSKLIRIQVEELIILLEAISYPKLHTIHISRVKITKAWVTDSRLNMFMKVYVKT